MNEFYLTSLFLWERSTTVKYPEGKQLEEEAKDNQDLTRLLFNCQIIYILWLLLDWVDVERTLGKGSGSSFLGAYPAVNLLCVFGQITSLGLFPDQEK